MKVYNNNQLIIMRSGMGVSPQTTFEWLGHGQAEVEVLYACKSPEKKAD